jgi:predicted RNA-binding protein (virulence factor B family)
MLKVGDYNTLEVVKSVDFGLYLDGDGQEILLPKRFVPKDAKEGDMLEVFLYHDNESRLIATTQRAKGVVGDIVSLKVVSITEHGAFMDWGIMKDIFVPLSQQVARMIEGQNYLVLIVIDEQTGRVAATERFLSKLSNENLTVKEMQEIDMTVWNKTDIGYKVIINNQHTGVIHYNEVFRELEYGEVVHGFIKRITPENKIDIVLGKPGHQRVQTEREKILQLLEDNNGYLPYSDKSAPEEIYNFFGMSKKTFKMTLGNLYKEKKIDLTKTGIKLIP